MSMRMLPGGPCTRPQSNLFFSWRGSHLSPSPSPHYQASNGIKLFSRRTRPSSKLFNSFTTVRTEVYEKRLFIFLSRRKKRRRHNTMETRHACGTSHYQICYFYRTSWPGESRATHTALLFFNILLIVLLIVILSILAQSKQTLLQPPTIGRWTLGGLLLLGLLHANTSARSLTKWARP